jgi:hypothetical protein
MLELVKSVSSQGSQMNEFDQLRLGSYLDAIDSYHAWVTAQPQLDLPETAPTTYVLRQPVDTPLVENESINDLIRMMTAMRGELVSSQSARQAAGLISFDSARLTAITGKARTFLTTYIEAVTPLDLPESSPEIASSGAGRTGI